MRTEYESITRLTVIFEYLNFLSSTLHYDVITLSFLTLACAYYTIALITYFLATSMQEITKQKELWTMVFFYTWQNSINTDL